MAKKPQYGHYTSLAGLLGIVQDERLWATNILFLNDEQEFQHALDLIRGIIPSSKIKAGHPDHATHTDYVADLSECLDSLKNYKSEGVFTLSFSEEPDLLSQWRGYCPGNNGYCIVFDAEVLLSKAKEQFVDCHLVKCVYEMKDKESQLKALLNKYWQQYYSASGKKGRLAVIELLAKEILLLASYFKHPSFAEEKESRIVILLEYSTDHEELKFREGRSSLIPYIGLLAPRSAIEKIYIGPTADKVLASRGLETLMEKAFGVPPFMLDCDIVHSETPYRSW
jgi:hypothetical protein